MNANGLDYDRAVAKYESDYKRNYDMLNMYRDDVREFKDDLNEEDQREYDRQRDEKLDARATLQTMYNQVSS